MIDQQPEPAEQPRCGVSRRRLLGAALGGGVVAGAAGFGIARATRADAGPRRSVLPFYGTRQAGVTTDAQDRLAFAAFDVTAADVTALQEMLGQWAAAAALMTRGELIGPTDSAPQAPPVDTGEAVDLTPAKLTITVGFGPSLFDERFGLAPKRPAALAPLPALPGDQLDPSSSDGDLCVQACSDDPQVAFHVIRNFARIGRGTVVTRWTQLGFGRTSTTSRSQATPRNLLGFKDGTDNIKVEDTELSDAYVWVGTETDQDWMRNGTYLVARRIRMALEEWDADSIADQEKTIGRSKNSGAPLGSAHEFDLVDLSARDGGGMLLIPPNSHIRLANPASNSGQRLLRRGYSFTDGTDPTTGDIDAGLFFIAFQKNAHKQFVPIQTNLGTNDALNEYITHTGSALFAIPPGVTEVGDYFGKALFS